MALVFGSSEDELGHRHVARIQVDSAFALRSEHLFGRICQNLDVGQAIGLNETFKRDELALQIWPHFWFIIRGMRKRQQRAAIVQLTKARGEQVTSLCNTGCRVRQHGDDEFDGLRSLGRPQLLSSCPLQDANLPGLQDDIAVMVRNNLRRRITEVSDP